MTHFENPAAKLAIYGHARLAVCCVISIAVLTASTAPVARAQNNSFNNMPQNRGAFSQQGNPQAGNPQSAPPQFSQPTAYNPNGFSPANAPRVATNPNLSANPGVSTTANKPDASGATPSNGTGETSTKPARSLLQIFHDGGLMMYPIALCSFVLTVFSFERLVSLRSGRVIPRPFVKRLLEQLQQQQIEKEEALELCEKNPSPMATIMAAGVKRYGRQAVEVEQAVLDAGERESNQLRRYMRLLNAISNISPLLGLLGTVMGMIQSFNDISSAQAMGRPDLLAGGISQALLTTAAGLLVAIPAYIMYIYFLGHTDRLIMEMDRHAQMLVDVISAEGLQEHDTSRSRSRTRKAAA